jgi:VanZ family protein
MFLKLYSRSTLITGTLIIWCIKFIVRPYVPVPFLMQPLVDVAPNLIGSILIPFGAYFFFKKYFKLETLQQLRCACFFGLMLGIVNEYLQLIPFFHRTFDYLDVLATFIGGYIGYKIFYKLMLRASLQSQLV